MNRAELLRCLADPTRLAILDQLADGHEFCVTDFIELTGKEQTNVSHHLAQLRACGLVESRRDGKRSCYRLAHPKLNDLLTTVTELAEHLETTDATACADAGCCE